METLSYGYLKPQTNDTGDVVFPAMQTNIQKINDHTHDGLNSARIATESALIDSGNWSSAPVPLAPFYQEITLPTGFTFDNTVISFKNSDGNAALLDVTKINSTSFYVFSNVQDNYTVYYR